MNILEIILGSMFFFSFNLPWGLYAIDIRKDEEVVEAILFLSLFLEMLSVILVWQLGLDPESLIKFFPFGDTLFDYLKKLLEIEGE